ncbi:MAG: helix-turn-helix transcriptional regulator [Bacteroidales bacterium]
MRTIILADNQEITNAGIRYLCAQTGGWETIRQAGNRKELVELLSAAPDAVVVLDYTLFDFTGIEELLIVSQRFPLSDWILFSDELSPHVILQVAFGSEACSIVLKDCPLEEIEASLRLAAQSERYLCRRIANFLANKKPVSGTSERPQLTPAEWEILKLLALGKTTKEIAEERFSSTHTIATHRKNIFRKLEVNNVHEATKYALRAGIIDLTEYCI